MANTLLGIDHYFYSLFNGDATLITLAAAAWALNQIPQVSAPGARADRWAYADIAPQAAAFPYVIWNDQSSTDSLGNAGARILQNSLFQVKVIGKGGSFSDIEAMEARMDALVQRTLMTPVLVDGVTIGGITRQSAIKYVDVQDNIRYNHLGGLYKIFTY